MEKILRDKGGGGEESCGRNSHNSTWSTLLHWFKQGWSCLVEVLELCCGSFWSQNAPILLKNSAPFFNISFCLCSPVMRRSRWLKAPIIPSSPSFLPSLVTAPLLQPAAAQQPVLLSAINIPSLSLWGILPPNLCRLSFPSRRTSIYLTLSLESLLILVTLMSWLSSGPEGFYSIHFLTIWYSQSRWDWISVSHSVNYEAQRDKNTINRNQKLI